MIVFIQKFSQSQYFYIIDSFLIMISFIIINDDVYV